MKPRLKKIEEIETDTHRIVILGDTATDGKEYAKAYITPRDKKK